MQQHGTFTNPTQNIRFERVVQNNVTIAGNIIVTLKCDWGSKDSYTPALNTSYGGEYSQYVLTNATQQQLPLGIAEIVLTYTSTFDSLPDPTVVENTSQDRAPIQQNPNFSGWASYWDAANKRFLDGTPMAGVTDYIIGSTTVTVTTYYNSLPAFNPSIIGQLQSPGGDYGTSDNWLVIGNTRQQQNNFWVVQTTYRYSAAGWNPTTPTIYNTAD